MIKITNTLFVHEDEIKMTFVTSPGPGGQNVNKVATAVLLRFNLLHSPAFSEELRTRLLLILANRITTQGDIIIKASRYRTQERNRQDAVQRLIDLLAHAVTPPKKRRKTKPTFSSVQKRLIKKKRHSIKKTQRRHNNDNY